jgi:Cys-tRNA(Pro)/Cys-tRNA(Cys) deacylase
LSAGIIEILRFNYSPKRKSPFLPNLEKQPRKTHLLHLSRQNAKIRYNETTIVQNSIVQKNSESNAPPRRKAMPHANNITRMLDAKKIPYTAYDLPAEKLGAVETAQRLGVPASVVYKTIVVVRRAKGKPILAIVPGDSVVNLKALAAALGEKKLRLPTEKEAEALTGLQAGGISPLALLNKGFQMVLDESAKQQEEIHISGGERGLNLRLRVEDILRLTRARVAPIAARIPSRE